MIRKISILISCSLIMLFFANNSFGQGVLTDYFNGIIANYQYKDNLVNAVSLNIVVNNVKGTGGWKVAQADGGSFLLTINDQKKTVYKSIATSSDPHIHSGYSYIAETEYDFAGLKYNGNNTTRTNVALQLPFFLQKFKPKDATLILFTSTVARWVVTSVVKIGNSLFGEINNGEMTFMITAKIITYPSGR